MPLQGSDLSYYNNADNYGNYQFVDLEHLINGFIVGYVGEDKIISKIRRSDIKFHAIRAIQELTYDVFKSKKSQEIEVPNTLQMILPRDYVNYVKITRVGTDGIERILYPTGKTSNPFAITQEADGTYSYDDDNALIEQSPSDTWENFQSNTPYISDSNDMYDNYEFDQFGRRYGLDPQHAQINGTFFIDDLRGLIHFGSALVGETVVLHYISDSFEDADSIFAHKFAEEAIYKWIAYAILSARSNVPEYIVNRFRKERFAAVRKAKIRLSNIKIEEFTQVLKGLSKPIK